MKKFIILIIVSICLATIISGCGKEKISPNDLKPMIMINGKIYLDTGIEEKIDKSQTADGEILSSVPQTEMPTEDGQSNFDAVGNSYCIDDKRVVVQLNGKWFRFEAE